MKTLFVVNASPVLQDRQVEVCVKPLQKQIMEQFVPIWHKQMVETNIRVEFATAHDIASLPPDSWPIFLNRHSNDEGALGWHDDDPAQNIRQYSRCFVGDCILMGLNWQTTLFHEADELILDPDVRRVFRMANGRLAAFEACDAVEDDSLAYFVDGIAASDFVTPEYFKIGGKGPFDYKGHLKKGCPGLAPGGYMSVTDSLGRWTQITMERGGGGLKGARAAMRGHRRQRRALIPMEQLEVVKDV